MNGIGSREIVGDILKAQNLVINNVGKKSRQISTQSNHLII
jgi:hypothetical protein